MDKRGGWSSTSVRPYLIMIEQNEVCMRIEINSGGGGIGGFIPPRWLWGGGYRAPCVIQFSVPPRALSRGWWLQHGAAVGYFESKLSWHARPPGAPRSHHQPEQESWIGAGGCHGTGVHQSPSKREQEERAIDRSCTVCAGFSRQEQQQQLSHPAQPLSTVGSRRRPPLAVLCEKNEERRRRRRKNRFFLHFCSVFWNAPIRF